MKQSSWIFTAAAVLTATLGFLKYAGPTVATGPDTGTEQSAVAQSLAVEKGAKLVIWTDPDWVPFMKDVTQSFNKELGHTVEFDVIAVSPLNGVQRLIQDGGTSRVGDVVEIVHNALGEAVNAGAVLENLVSAQRVATDFIPPAAHAATYRDVVYGFPTSFQTVALFYNKDLLPKAPASFEELLAFAPGFNDKVKNRYTLLWGIQNYYFSRMFLTLFGGYEFGKNGTDSKDFGIASDAAVQGLTAMLELKKAANVSSADMVNPLVPRGLFSEGKVAAIIEGPWASQALMESGRNVGVVPIPTFKGRHPRTFSTVTLAVVSSYSPYPQAAQLFAAYLTSDAILEKRYNMLGSVPPSKALIERVAPTASPTTKAIIQQAEYSDAMPSIPEMAFLWSPMSGALVDAWNNGKPAAEVLKTAKGIIDEQMELDQQEGK
jgi:arabinogalactan oligomer/maltooligosaccharide transport system substrate-binding protein